MRLFGSNLGHSDLLFTMLLLQCVHYNEDFGMINPGSHQNTIRHLQREQNFIANRESQIVKLKVQVR